MSDWKEDTRRSHALATALAPLLGDDWQDATNAENVIGAICRQDGAGLSLRVNDGRATISGRYPQGAYNICRYSSFEIGVAVSRGPEAIAREITRRLLPHYLPEYTRVVGLVLADAKAEANRNALAEELAEEIGATAEGGRFRHYPYTGASADVHVDYDARSVRIDAMNLSADQARAILAIVKAG